MIKNYFRAFVVTFAFVLSFSLAAAAQTSPTAFPNVKINNFGQMDERYYRGAQPLPDDYQSLKDLGVNMVIDLRNDPTDYEKTAVEALGMKYVNIPMSGWRSPKDAKVEEFLKLVNDPANVVFAHCKAGIHRTGLTGAVYRFTKYGWDYDKAYAEMKNYKFSTGLVHGALKGYVKDYAERMEEQKAKTTTAAAGASQASQ
jgi:protein tyrosine/serine phosphatase